MRLRLLLLTLAALACACGPKLVSLEALKEFPTPLVEPLPVRVGVHYPPDFTTYSYSEKRPGPAGQDWTITLGAPQQQVFRTVFAALFERVEELGSPQAAGSGLAAVIVPRVAEFQFALPRETKAKVFEIWVKYDLGIYAADGGELGHWQFTAYGKTPTAFMTSDEEAIRAATIVALRDAGASLVSGIERDPRIREWLGVSPGAQEPATQAGVAPGPLPPRG
jgi:hypothetical protein